MIVANIKGVTLKMNWRKILSVLGELLCPSLGIFIGYHFRVWEYYMFWVIGIVAVGAALFCELAPDRKLLTLLKIVIALTSIIASVIALRLSVNEYIIVDALIFCTIILEFNQHKKRQKVLKKR